jgi:hypothetical protein
MDGLTGMIFLVSALFVTSYSFVLMMKGPVEWCVTVFCESIAILVNEMRWIINQIKASLLVTPRVNSYLLA